MFPRGQTDGKNQKKLIEDKTDNCIYKNQQWLNGVHTCRHNIHGSD